MKLYIFLIFILATRLFPAEIILKSGEAYIADIIQEERTFIKIKWKERVYTLPKDDIFSVDRKKTGKHISYAYYQFIMKDGSKIKGVIAEETEDKVTVNSDMGFIILEKSKIVKRIGPEDPGKEINLEKKYAEPDILLPETMVGFGGSYYSNHSPLSQTNSNTYGGFLFLEPDFFRWKENMKFGYQIEYLVSPGKKARYDFLNNLVYFQYSYQKKENSIIDFYIQIGGGVSNERYQSYERVFTGTSYAALGDTRGRNGGTTNSAFNPLSKISIGWKGIKYNNFQVRLFIENTTIYEPGTLVSFSGGGMALVYVF